MKKIKVFLLRHKELLLYFLFGIVTTVCSLAACYLTLKLGLVFPVFKGSDGEPTELLDVIGSTVQWIVGVLVAFFTNKYFVFSNAPRGQREGFNQFGVFAASRVGTYLLEVVINLAVIYLLELLGYRAMALTLGTLTVNIPSRFWAKAVSSVVVTVTNYFISKILVFRRKEKIR